MNIESIILRRRKAKPPSKYPNHLYPSPESPVGRKPIMPEATLFAMEQLKEAIIKAKERMLFLQNRDGHWVFDLEADVTIPSEYIFLQHFLERDMEKDLRTKLATYIRRRQLDDGGWPLYTGGKADLSATVKAYFALKLVGDSQDDLHMVKARRLILKNGGAERVNVFTRITLALFGQIPWHTVPAMPPEIMFLPKWFFFNLYRISYWSRTVKVPLLIIYAGKPVHRPEPGKNIRELFLSPPDQLRHLDGYTLFGFQKNVFILLDRMIKRTEHLIPFSVKEKATSGRFFRPWPTRLWPSRSWVVPRKTRISSGA